MTAWKDMVRPRGGREHDEGKMKGDLQNSLKFGEYCKCQPYKLRCTEPLFYISLNACHHILDVDSVGSLLGTPRLRLMKSNTEAR